MSSILKSKTAVFFLILIATLAVTMTLFTPISKDMKLAIRIALIATFLVAWKFFEKKERVQAKNIAFALLVLNLAFLVVSFFPGDLWFLDMETSKGFGLSKLGESAIICLAVILSFYWGGFKIKSLYLTRGRLLWGLVTGVLFFTLFGFLAINNPQHTMDNEFLRRNAPWILIFAFSNGFMEELIFRGILLKKFIKFMNPHWAILLTSLCFATPHLFVSYNPDVIYFFGIVFVLGMLCGYAMHYTKSMLAPTLIHAGADLMIILPVFVSYGIVH